MPLKSKPYEQFGPFILFRRLETDALGDLWRAASIDGSALGPITALRRFTGGNREALTRGVEVAQQVAPLLTGPSFVRDQSAGVVHGIPYVAWEYSGGRSLRHIVERARGGASTPANPIPIDQALVIVERVALSLATTAELRFGGDRLSHGALIPQFIWITDDGEIRVAGQQFGKGLVASLHDEKVAAESGRYFSTEYTHSGAPTRTSEVYSLGAILYLTLTGHEPPDATRASAFVQAVRGTKTMAGAPVPDDIRQILEKSLNLDPSARFASVADMKQALSTVSAKYGATSFNLAFYVSNLLKKEMESETLDRERESRTSVLPYLEVTAAPAPAVTPSPSRTRQRSKAPLALAAVAVLAVAGVGGWMAFGSKKPVTAAPAAMLAATMAPIVKPQPVVPEPIVASPAIETTRAPIDEAARKKAFDDAVRQRLNEELMKLQAEYNRQLQREAARKTPAMPAPPPAPVVQKPAVEVAEEPAPSAAQLDQARRELLRAQIVETATAQPIPTQPVVSTQPPPPAVAAPMVASVRDGDVIDMTELDVAPRRVRDPRVMYPPIAARQRIETTVMATVLVSETGEVVDVKILRGDPRFGFNEAAIRALQAARYTSPIKSGHRVRTWIPQMVQFKP
jgi:TonB family protein